VTCHVTSRDRVVTFAFAGVIMKSKLLVGLAVVLAGGVTAVARGARSGSVTVHLEGNQSSQALEFDSLRMIGGCIFSEP
jgi:hypothetical protein